MASEPSSLEINAFLTPFTQGKYADSEIVARQLLERFPHSGTCWKLLGASLGQQGRLAESLEPMKMCAKLLPTDAESQFNLGVIQQGLNQLEEAKTAYQQAIALNPRYVEAYNNLGLVLQAVGCLEEAVNSFRHALAIKPQHAEAHNNLGILLQDLNQIPEAADCYRQAIQINPNYFEAQNNLGGILKSQGKLKEAENVLRQALQLNSHSASALNNLGNLLQSQGRTLEAETTLRRALEIDAQHSAAWNNLGNTLQAQQRFGDAESCFLKALEINPQDVNAHCNLGAALQEKGQLLEAESAYRRALHIDPNNYGARSNLLFCLNYTNHLDSKACLAEAQRYGSILLSNVTNPFLSWSCAENPQRLKVGLVSGDMLNHPVGYFLEGILANINPARIDLIAYPTHPHQDELTERIRPRFSAWQPLYGLSDEAASQRIHADGIHVLIDLSGHTAYNRLATFAKKPAPVQVSWLGYFATTGLPTIDYLIADPWTLPESEEQYFTERIWRLPDTRLCFTPPKLEIAVSPLPALSNGFITFGCFNHFTKMNEEVVATWAAILASVPDSRLLLKSKQFNALEIRQRAMTMFEKHHISPDRLIIEGSSPRSDYFSAYHRVDIALDPFPFTGGTTSAEGLWMGVPMLTLTGERFVSRQGVGLLMNAGLAQWIAADKNDYVNQARMLSSDLPALAELRATLRERVLNSPIFDAGKFARNLETALWEMWNNYKLGS